LACGIFTCLNYGLEVIELDTNCAALLNLLLSDIIKANKILDGLRNIVLLHRDDLSDVLMSSEDAGEFSLIQDVVDSLDTHGIEEADRGLVVVHVGDVACEPFPPVLGPDSNKVPLAAVTLCLGDEILALHSAG